jgi:very-short-patch-repair endonuclease
MFYGAKAGTFAAAEALRRHMTVAEAILWNKLKDKKLFNVKFRRQHPIDFFIVDFYCHSKKLVIEIDGDIHDTAVRQEYDQGRTGQLEQYGITVIRFTNDDIKNDLISVLSQIQEVISD